MVGHILELQPHFGVGKENSFGHHRKPVCEKAFHVFHNFSNFFCIEWLDLLLHSDILRLWL